MNPPADATRRCAAELAAALAGRLLAARTPEGRWEGRLSSSALSTAVAAAALERIDPISHEARVRSARAWIVRHRNSDGGWGDTPDSPANPSTTLIAWAALGDGFDPAAAESARRWVERNLGGAEPAVLARTLRERYGDDRTFSAPLLTFCALLGRLGPEPEAWHHVPQLPFELAVLPRGWFAALRLPVVSYALPALIAIGLVRHVRARGPLGLVRDAATAPVLRRLTALQPSGGGFLEAAPLTGFVALSLAAAGHRDHAVVRAAARFLAETQRDDGSWPIDTDLASWVTFAAANALCRLPEPSPWPEAERLRLRAWLLARQFREAHPFTDSPPGGWGWSPRSGAAPDADDTACALRALRALGPADEPARAAAAAGVGWFLGLQNRDGGIPTFCRGWSRFPFDRSCPDLTAHALRAFRCWRQELDPDLRRRMDEADARMRRYLRASQNPDGSWTPLWFGSQSAPGQENRTFGTAAVLRALASETYPADAAAVAQGRAWLLASQRESGGWGGGGGAPPTIEETALAVGALAAQAAVPAVARGVAWLADAWSRPSAPAPIGLYFARLWYSERLYPLVFSLDALGKVLA